MSTKYSVTIQPFAERHYIKSFSKKYRRIWEVTLQALLRQFQSFDVLLERKMADIIVMRDEVKICKVDFAIAGSNESRHGSGNRCIIALHCDSASLKILLVYHKNDLGHGNETVEWKNIIRANYSEYRDLL